MTIATDFSINSTTKVIAYTGAVHGVTGAGYYTVLELHRWLQDLAASESPATRALLRIALTPQDNIVYPQREQVLPGAPVTVFDGLGHLQLCLAPAVIAWVLAVIGAACVGVSAYNLYRRLGRADD